MRIARKLLMGVLVIAAFGNVQAQPADDTPSHGDETELGVEAKLSPEEMAAKADQLLAGMDAVLKRVIELQQDARKQQDIIKLNCVNDKLLQVKQLLNIAENSKTDLSQAIAERNEGDRYHQFTRITVASDKSNALRDEAEACVGQELVFVGPSTVDVDKPPIIDDPTAEDPFVLGGFEIERPTYATPFL